MINVIADSGADTFLKVLTMPPAHVLAVQLQARLRPGYGTNPALSQKPKEGEVWVLSHIAFRVHC